MYNKKHEENRKRKCKEKKKYKEKRQQSVNKRRRERYKTEEYIREKQKVKNYERYSKTRKPGGEAKIRTLKEQLYSCAICKIKKSEDARVRFYLDKDLFGILGVVCNSSKFGLVRFKRNLDILRAAIAHLSRHQI